MGKLERHKAYKIRLNPLTKLRSANPPIEDGFLIAIYLNPYRAPKNLYRFVYIDTVTGKPNIYVCDNINDVYPGDTVICKLLKL